MRNPKYHIAQIVAVSLLVLGPSQAVSAEKDHESGFFLRLAIGGEPASTELSDSFGDSVELSGVGTDIEIAIGGIIAPNLALHGTIWGWVITDPDAEVAVGGSAPMSGELSGDLTLSALGGGLTYYFMPINIYLTGSIGFGSMSIDLGGVSGDTDTGLALEAAVGKEWFVSNRWGLGLAVGITYHSFPDPDVDESWSGISIPVRFSATFN